MSKIALQLTNDLAVPVSLNVLGGTSDESNQNNADTLYEWNLSAENWVNVDTVIIQSRLKGQTIYQNYSTSITNLSVQGVANALSTLNLGNFLVNGNIVYTYNSDIEFGDITLSLTNVPIPTSYTQLIYDHFVPAGSVLQQQVYPTLAAFESDFGPAITLLFQQTNAASAIDTYGPGCIYPICGVTAVSSAFYLTMNAPSPKAPSLRPIMSTSQGTSQGYLFSSVSFSNAILYLPSGNASEINQFGIAYGTSYIFYFDPAIWPALTNLTYQRMYSKMTPQGTISDLSGLTQFDYDPIVANTYPTGWTAPAFSNPNKFTCNLDAPGISPTQTFITSTDFVWGTNTAYYSYLEGYNNIYYNPIGSPPVSQGQYWQIQYNNNVVLGPNCNQNYALYAGQFVVDTNFDMGFSNNNVSWADLATPIKWNGFRTIKMDGINLANFPPILEMNRYQNLGPVIFDLQLNLSSNNLPVSVVNQILIDIDTNATAGRSSFVSCIINLSNQSPLAPPSGAGITAKNNLIAKGISVITD